MLNLRMKKVTKNISDLSYLLSVWVLLPPAPATWKILSLHVYFVSYPFSLIFTPILPYVQFLVFIRIYFYF